uniref:TLC domain-containing protein n=1 Tax=Trichobilharzia regenti TaxID=157069 RepID=A0AA85JWT4_TRIRE|nr:unnamed protein product [Trichobilharzia regenti]
MFESKKCIFFLLFTFYPAIYCQSTIFDPETGKYYPISDTSRIEDIPFLLPDPDPKEFPPEFLESLLKHCDDPMPGYIEMLSKAWIAFKELGLDWSRCPSLYVFARRILIAIHPMQIMHAVLVGALLTILRLCIKWRFLTTIIHHVGVTPEISNKLIESSWKAFWFLSMWLFSLKVVLLSGKTDFQYPLRALRGVKFEVGYFDIPTPSDYYYLYTLQLGFYLHSFWSVFFMDAWRKDSNVLVVHHILAVLLLESSLVLRLHRVGVLVLFLHDLCDVFLELAKVNIYLRIRHGKSHPIHMTIANIFFALFSTSWVVLRLYWYPLKVLYATSWGAYIALVGRESRGFLFFNSMLWGLFLMHIYWFTFILRMAVRLLTSPLEACDDVREDEGSSSDNNKKSDNDDSNNLSNHKTENSLNTPITTTATNTTNSSSYMRSTKLIDGNECSNNNINDINNNIDDNNNNNSKPLTNGSACVSKRSN